MEQASLCKFGYGRSYQVIRTDLATGSMQTGQPPSVALLCLKVYDTRESEGMIRTGRQSAAPHRFLTMTVLTAGFLKHNGSVSVTSEPFLESEVCMIPEPIFSQ